MFVFRKDSALEVGGFSESHLIAEDSIFAIQMAKLAKAQGKNFGFLKTAGIVTFERKNIKLASLPKLATQVIKAFLGIKQTSKELPFWYNPKR